jgi:hypothetical protein
MATAMGRQTIYPNVAARTVIQFGPICRKPAMTKSVPTKNMKKHHDGIAMP